MRVPPHLKQPPQTKPLIQTVMSISQVEKLDKIKDRQETHTKDLFRMSSTSEALPPPQLMTKSGLL